MAWTSVTVTHGKSSYEALQRRNEVAVPMAVGTPKTIKIDGEAVNVLKALEDMRGEFMTLTVDCEIEEAAEAETKEEVSDDQPDERGDDD